MQFKVLPRTILYIYLSAEDGLLVDLPDYTHPETLYTSILPDVTVVRKECAHILELTCCYEQNFEKSRQYKLEKYHNPERGCQRQLSFMPLTTEVSSLG